MPPDAPRLYTYCNAVMEPWDGPAAIAAFDGSWAVAGMDRNGLRPHALRASPPTAADRRLRGRHGAAGRERDRREGPRSARARCSPSIWTQAQLYKDRELKDMLADTPRLRRVDRARTVELDALIKQRRAEPPSISTTRRAAPPPVRRRLVDRGSRADPPAHGRGRQGSRRLDGRRHAARGAVATLSRPLHHFFRQNFSQVTNPPIDCLREQR